jgi:segregation and condensation protein B
MPPLDLQGALEALLFSSDQPLVESLIAEALETPPAEVSEALQQLGASYAARNAGVELREIAGGWMLVTTAAHAEWVGRMLRGRKRMRLSRPALETMAIIAYKQPVTKSEVEAIRGVDSSGTLATLLERGLVTIKGRSTVVGRPLLYGSTPDFLNYFGLKDLTELPRPEELRALVAAREPEQLDMLELDGEALPALAAREGDAGAGVETPDGVPVATDLATASDDEESSDDEYDDDEFEDDDEDEDDEDESDEAGSDAPDARATRVTRRDPR